MLREKIVATLRLHTQISLELTNSFRPTLCDGANTECVLFQNLDRSRLRLDRHSPVKKNAECFARSDLDLSDCEKERTHCISMHS